MRRRGVVVGLLALTVMLAASAPAVAGGHPSDAFAGRPAGVFLSGLWTRVLELLEELVAAPPAPRQPKVSVAADDDGGAPPPEPPGRGGMDPNG